VQLDSLRLEGTTLVWWDRKLQDIVSVLIFFTHALLHIEKFVTTTCDKSTVSLQHARDFFFFLNLPCVHCHLDAYSFIEL
jgi:hypothetical protein